MRNRRRRGFSLAEMAIVLGVVSIIIGAIWIAAAHAWGNYRVYKILQEMTTTVDNIRDHYTAIGTWQAAWINTDQTSTFDSSNLLPVDMRLSPTPGAGALHHAANGLFQVWPEIYPVGGITTFRVKLMGLDQSACIKLLMQAPLGDPQIGMVQAIVNNAAGSTAKITNFTGTGGTATWNIGTPPAVPAATATAWCDNSAGGGTNEIDLEFKLH